MIQAFGWSMIILYVKLTYKQGHSFLHPRSSYTESFTEYK